MGMASSQARLLALTSRQHDVELHAQALQARKLQLANDSDLVYNNYVNALNDTKIQYRFTNQNGESIMKDASLNGLENGLIGQYGSSDQIMFLQSIDGSKLYVTPAVNSAYKLDQVKNIGSLENYFNALGIEPTQTIESQYNVQTLSGLTFGKSGLEQRSYTYYNYTLANAVESNLNKPMSGIDTAGALYHLQRMPKFDEKLTIEVATARELVEACNNFSYATIILTNDIDMSDIPASTEHEGGVTYLIKRFYGTLDGNGHTITNTKAALFANLGGATVQDLNFKDCEAHAGAVEATSGNSAVYGQAGILANYASLSTVINCSVSDSILISDYDWTPKDDADPETNYYLILGGLVGNASAGHYINNRAEGLTFKSNNTSEKISNSGSNPNTIHEGAIVGSLRIEAYGEYGYITGSQVDVNRITNDNSIANIHAQGSNPSNSSWGGTFQDVGNYLDAEGKTIREQEYGTTWTPTDVNVLNANNDIKKAELDANNIKIKASDIWDENGNEIQNNDSWDIYSIHLPENSLAYSNIETAFSMIGKDAPEKYKDWYKNLAFSQKVAISLKVSDFLNNYDPETNASTKTLDDIESYINAYNASPTDEANKTPLTDYECAGLMGVPGNLISEINKIDTADNKNSDGHQYYMLYSAHSDSEGYVDSLVRVENASTIRTTTPDIKTTRTTGVSNTEVVPSDKDIANDLLLMFAYLAPLDDGIDSNFGYTEANYNKILTKLNTLDDTTKAAYYNLCEQFCSMNQSSAQKDVVDLFNDIMNNTSSFEASKYTEEGYKYSQSTTSATTGFNASNFNKLHRVDTTKVDLSSSEAQRAVAMYNLGLTYDIEVIPDKLASSSEYVTNMINNAAGVLMTVDTSKVAAANYSYVSSETGISSTDTELVKQRDSIANSIVKLVEHKDVNVATSVYLEEVANTAKLTAAQAEYETNMRNINRKETLIDTELSALESERSAIKTEQDELKQVAKDNVDMTFKLFS